MEEETTDEAAPHPYLPFGVGSFLEAAEFEGALLKGGGVAVEADRQFQCGFVLGVDDLFQGAVVFTAKISLVANNGLELSYEPVDDDAAQEQQQTEGGEEKPAVVHGGGVVDRF
jgi:hypothetical protein